MHAHRTAPTSSASPLLACSCLGLLGLTGTFAGVFKLCEAHVYRLMYGRDWRRKHRDRLRVTFASDSTDAPADSESDSKQPKAQAQ